MNNDIEAIAEINNQIIIGGGVSGNGHTGITNIETKSNIKNIIFLS